MDPGTFSWGSAKMQIRCIHGYFIFREHRVGELSDFVSMTGLRLVSKEDYFTFEALENAPDYTIEGAKVLGATAIKTFEGRPWEVFEANALVYDFIHNKVVPISQVTQKFNIKTALNKFVTSGLILPGSIAQDGRKVRDFQCWTPLDRINFQYSEVRFV